MTGDHSLHIVSLALGGCLRGEPVAYGITEDTGGHIAYILGEMRALAAHGAVTQAEIVTRLFDAPELGAIHGCAHEPLGPKLSITRIDSGNRAYLAKEALAADRDAFARAFITHLRARDRLPDLIHAHFADAADVAARVRRELGIPFIYTAHSLGIDKRDCAMAPRDTPTLQARIAEEDAAIARADAIVASSVDECERQLPAYPSADAARIHRLRPGVDMTVPDAAARAGAAAMIAPFLRHADRPIVLAVARPVAKKNLVALVEAFGRDPRLRHRANLVLLAGLRKGLVGGEPEQDRVLSGIADAIDRHDLHGHVAWPRNHSRDEVQALYALARDSGGVFVNPALTEPYGLTLIEAASHGLPVVATCRGGPADIVGELENGLLVEPTDRAEIANAVRTLIEDRPLWLRASNSGREGVRSMGWDRYASGFVALAREVTGRVVANRAVMPVPRALALCDIDNTLTGCAEGARRLSAYLARHRDTVFGVATGRSILEAQRVLREWSLPFPSVWVTSVGSEIYWQRGEDRIADHDYARSLARGWDGDAVHDALRDLPTLTPQGRSEQREFKRSYFLHDPARLAQVRERLDRAGLKTRVIFSHEKLLDILPVEGGKAAAMRHVATTLGLTPEDVFAAGDSGNDIDMLTDCRNAILVGNHAPELARLSERDNVYLTRRHHAGGTLEGIVAHRFARRRGVAA
ncbi:HAD-IIB family hydrolase [Croceicoccus sp. YJ47]|uniref:HAD-IIB family hydrolase n=1 Tax=Croceicoccus sp. YJ47 TaxID=2798724 RepID=UPI001920840A|nr:HAD-IIB family hydrolase [Croceicoccus sp. YJ47]QQN74144.1 HAD-IIB family hydrolase [Croceicoccus sp. YJ47]